MQEVKRAELSVDWELPVPVGLRQAELPVEDAEPYLVLSYPLPRWRLPGVLTAAEQEIALAILAGASRSEVAQARGTSIRTVSNLLAQMFRKLGVGSRIELAARLSEDAPGQGLEP
jgi:DNA-binding CsgD family transcriptional regulator